MSKASSKAEASSSRAAQGFGSGFSDLVTRFGRPSPLSYQAQLQNDDYASLSDQNLAVNFKNLAKKDPSTKSKALERLRDSVESCRQNPNDLDAAFLDLWVKVFPRASIDVDRRVRQLAQNITASVITTYGKRITPLLPQIVTSWLAGLFDADRNVTKTVSDSLDAIFPSSEKKTKMWKNFQPAIVQFCIDTAFRETSSSLSDEKSTTPEDSEDMYVRVTSSHVYLLAAMISQLDLFELQKCRQSYEKLFEAQEFWHLLSSKQPRIRKSIYTLLETCLDRCFDILAPQVSTIAGELLSKSSIRHQHGSSVDFVNVLVAFSRHDSRFWSRLNESNIPFTDRLQRILEHGSYGGLVQYWQTLPRFFQSIPKDLLGLDQDKTKASKLLDCLATGISQKDEPRANLESAWLCYFEIADSLFENLSDENSSMIVDSILPRALEYIREGPKNPIRGPPAPDTAMLKALERSRIRSIVAQNWQALSQALVDDIKESISHANSSGRQTDLINRGSRFLYLQEKLLGFSTPPMSKERAFQVNSRLMQECINALKISSGAAFGASGIMNAIMAQNHLEWQSENSIPERIDAFVSSDVPSLMPSAARRFLINILYRCHALDSFEGAWDRTLEKILALPEPLEAIFDLLYSPCAPVNFELAAKAQALQDYLVNQGEKSLQDDSQGKTFQQIIQAPYPSLSTVSRNHLLSKLSDALHFHDHGAETFIEVTNRLRAGREDILAQLLAMGRAPKIFCDLIKLSADGFDDAKDTFMMLIEILAEVERKDTEGRTTLSDTLDQIVQSQLDTAGSESLDIASLMILVQCNRIIRKAYPKGTTNFIFEGGEIYDEDVSRFLPDAQRWRSALDPFLAVPPRPDTSICSLNVGCLLIRDTSEGSVTFPERDRQGCTPALRYAAFTMKLLQRFKNPYLLPSQILSQVLFNFALTGELLEHTLSRAQSDTIFADAGAKDRSFVEKLLDDINELMKTLGFVKTSKTGPAILEEVLEMLQNGLDGDLPCVYYYAQAYNRAFSCARKELTLEYFFRSAEQKIQQWKTTDDVLAVLSNLTQCSKFHTETALMTKTVNQIVDEMQRMSVAQNQGQILRCLVFLVTIISNGGPKTVLQMSKQRLLFFAKTLSRWLHEETALTRTKSQIFRVLVDVLGEVRHISGGHWDEVALLVSQIWNHCTLKNSVCDHADEVLLWYNTMELTESWFEMMEDSKRGGEEEALLPAQDALDNHSDSLASGILQLATEFSSIRAGDDKIIQTFDRNVCWQLQNFHQSISDTSQLLPLINAKSRPLQETAFTLLRPKIRESREEVSVNTALENSVAQLPPELIDNLKSSPEADDLTTGTRTSPESFAYFISWLLVFEHFNKASDRVKADYENALKEAECLDGLLDLTFSFLGHTKGKPAKAADVEPTTYDITLEKSPQKDLKWILVHLYYLSLKHLSRLARTWWNNNTTRQTKDQVEEWTKQYISPSLIRETQQSVTQYRTSTASRSDPPALAVTNTPTSPEIHLTREVDDQTLQIAITLPPTYPLAHPTAHGIRKLASNTREWNSWLMVADMTMLRENSVVEGIRCLQNLVSNRLKGVTTCTICQCELDDEGKVPEKKCPQCAQRFHPSCLYRWFKQSARSDCPLCRNPFTYG